jgi:outer membrane lipoprotein LolB
MISGCATTSVVAPADRAVAWQARQSELAPVDTWDLRGRVAVRFGNDSGQAVLHWVRNGAHYRVDLIFPFGAGSLRLTQDAEGAELRDSENRIYRGSSGRALLTDTVGWELPIDELNYWALGLPAPGPVTRTAFDDQARLAELEQGEWHIEFADYLDFGRYMLPSRIEITRNATENDKPVDVRLSVLNWNLSESKKP